MSQPTRVLLVSGSVYQLGGMERVMQTVARELVRYGYESQVVIPQQPMAEQIREWFGQFGARVAISDELAALSRHGIRAVPGFARYLRSRRSSLVNLHSPGPHVPLAELLACRLAGLSVVTSIHGFDDSVVAGPGQRWRNILLGSPLNNAVIVMNQTLERQQKTRGIASRKLELVYNAVVAPDDTVTRESARRQLTIGKDTFVMISFCRLVQDKGIDILLDSLRELPDELLRQSRLFIGGAGPELENLRNRVVDRTRGTVYFLGHVRDPSPYYAAADVLVAPSRHEPFGLVFLEAGQYGIPSIGTKVGGIPEVVVSGVTGLLIEPENPRGLADAIIMLSKDPDLRRRLGEAARQRVRARYSVEAMLQGYARVFHKVLGQQALPLPPR